MLTDPVLQEDINGCEAGAGKKITPRLLERFNFVSLNERYSSFVIGLLLRFDGGISWAEEMSNSFHLKNFSCTGLYFTISHKLSSG